MKQQWAPQELLDHWTLTPEEITLVRNISQIEYNQLGYGVLLKIFQWEGKFPQRKQDVPRLLVEHIGQQLHVGSHVFDTYSLKGRTIERHRSYIRRFLGIRIGTVRDAKSVRAWLSTHHQLLEEHNLDRLREVVYERYKELKIEPPESKRVERIVHSAVWQAGGHGGHHTAEPEAGYRAASENL